MNTTRVRGTKQLHDKITLLLGNAITVEQVCKLLLLLWDNEDKIRPSPRYEGSQMLKDLIDELYEKREITNELLIKYKSKPGA